MGFTKFPIGSFNWDEFKDLVKKQTTPMADIIVSADITDVTCCVQIICDDFFYDTCYAAGANVVLPLMHLTNTLLNHNVVHIDRLPTLTELTDMPEQDAFNLLSRAVIQEIRAYALNNPNIDKYLCHSKT